jgi:hypothetical protein
LIPAIVSQAMAIGKHGQKVAETAEAAAFATLFFPAKRYDTSDRLSDSSGPLHI